ncbi:MAG: hypothetical protein R2849_10695 [Thermomicrobiales bacterium]
MSDQNPLGSAASYGVPLPLDRRYVSGSAGLKVQNNVLYTQLARQVQGAIVQALVQVMLDLSKLAQDILLFTTAEYGFFKINDSLLTGSEHHAAEEESRRRQLLRARGQVMLAYQQQIVGVLTGLPSGYNMDSQDTKKPFMDALDLAAQSAAVAALFVSQIEPDEEKMADSCSPELFATDIAYDLVRSGTAFRDAYREIAGKIADLPGQDPKAHLEHRTHQGTHGDLRLGDSKDEIDRRTAQIEAREQELAEIQRGLLSGERLGLGNR